MAATLSCPNMEEYRRSLRGEASDTIVASLAAHLESCPHCLAMAETIPEYDLPRALPTVVETAPESADPAWWNDVLRRLKSMDLAWLSGTALLGDSSGDGDPAEELSFLAPPQGEGELGRLAEYRVLRVLGLGGMGLVLEAEDTRLKRRVAVKVMRTRFSARAESRERFLREARAVAALEHDHIVPIYQVAQVEQSPYIVMPLLRGGSIDTELVRRGVFSAGEILAIGKQAASGLAYAHEHGIVHRDIKPANLWLETRPGDAESTRVRLLDFGLARGGDDASEARLTQSGVIAGTPAYMSPEQARGGEADFRSDLFSLGAVLYEMATGRRPFSGENTMAILSSLALDQPKSPREFQPELPEELADSILRLLDKDPTRRPASAAETARLLRDMESSAGLSTRGMAAETVEESRSSPASGVGGTAATKRDETRNEQHGATRRERKPGKGRILASLVGLALIAGFGLYGKPITRFVTNKGTLTVDIDDPDIEIRVTRGELILQDKTDQREFVLTAGEGEIEVYQKDGVRLATKQFKLGRGGTTRVSVTWEEPSAVTKAPNATEGAVNVNRALAGLITRAGGVVQLRGQEGKDFTKPEELPKSPIELYWLELLNPDRAELDEFIRLEQQAPPGPRILWIGGAQLSNEDVALLSRAEGLSNVYSLELLGPNLTIGCLATLGEFDSLNDLHFRGPPVTDEWLFALGECRFLKQLHFDNVPISDAGLASLKNLELEVLTIFECHRVTNEGVLAFSNMRSLRHLDLNGLNVDDSGLTVLDGLPGIERLHLEKTGITDATLRRVSRLNKLLYLNLRGTRIGDQGLESLANSTTLSDLEIRETQVTASAVEALRSKLPKCRIYSDFGEFPPQGIDESRSHREGRRIAEWARQ